ncbi:methionine aminotransferase [Castellaniella sp. GW247-6E4]|uniref:methionine aminotransferase n=1 Tax=Castellaniella sp. GW247-6E4 TaxID=3140380 RepID=UPI0033154823
MRSKLPNVGVTIFTEMSQLALAHHAINLGQGFPDYNPDALLMQCVSDAMLAGHNQYAPMAGVPTLREAVAEKVARLQGQEYDPGDEITITSGATEALASAMIALIHVGDEVILIDPSYDLYAPVVRLAGGITVRVPMTPPTARTKRFTIDWSALEAAIGPRTRMIVLNFPNNPTGTILGDGDLERLEKITQQHNVLLLSDEAYEHIVFDGEPHRSLASRPALADKTIVVSSFGKTFHATGWKIGYFCAPKALTAEIRKIHQFIVFSVPTPIQHGVAAYMRQHARLDQLPAFYQQKRDRLKAGLEGSAFRPLDSQGTFFLLVDTSALGNLKEKDLAQRLTIEHGVGTIPVSAFYEDPDDPSANHRLLRLCFAKQDQTLDRAVEALRAVRGVGA